MIITCASCLTKFNLDDSKIPAKGVKVRCSKCQHVFYVVPPPGTKEEVIEDLKSFAKYHEELMEPDKEEEMETLRRPEVKAEAMAIEEETFTGETEHGVPLRPVEEERAEDKLLRPKRIVQTRKRRSSASFLAILVVVVLLMLGLFYLWTEFGYGRKLLPYLEYPVKKITDLWNRVLTTEKKGLVVGNLNGYEEKVGEIPLLVIEGKVENQSRSTKKFVRIKIVIFDQEKAKVVEKETVCGRILSRDQLKNLPPSFFKGEMVIDPKSEKEKIAPPGQAVPFMVIFRDLPDQAKEFKVEIVEAPGI